ncbi:MAG TPA: hypothetical protein VM597_33980 [Gemmataceae bacterium]|jgi:hypothetical protein|nr:hypothetical protein [Gemmataceae bacterium]
MRRRRLLVSVGQVVAFVALVLFGLGWAAKRVPAFYTESELPDDAATRSKSVEAIGGYFQMRDAIVESNNPRWELAFTAEQLNAYFQHDFVVNHGGDANLPEGFSAPRVQIEDGRMRIGVQYGQGYWTTVLSIQLKVWLVPGKANVLAMEIESLKAGALPLSPATLLDKISEVARRQNIDVTWFRENGHPVAIMRFQADLTRPTLVFEQIDLANGKLTVQGRSADPFGAQRKN